MTRDSALDLVDRLAAHRTLASAPREQLVWLAAHGHLLRLATGEILTSKTGPVRGLFVVLSGHLFIGAAPRTEMVAGLIGLDDERLRAHRPGPAP